MSISFPENCKLIRSKRVKVFTGSQLGHLLLCRGFVFSEADFCRALKKKQVKIRINNIIFLGEK